MLRMITQRLATATLSLVILVTIVFFMTHATPGGPAFSILGQKATPAAVNALNQRLGLTAPLWLQYAIWWWHLLQGKLGYSYLLNRPVTQLIGDYMMNTLALYIGAILLALVLSIGLGLVQGVTYGRWPARLIGALQLSLYALPTFFVGTMFILYFGVKWPILPTGGISNLRIEHPGLLDYAHHLVLPILTVGLLGVAALSRYFGTSVHEELGKDYVRTALAKGLTFRAVLFRHVLRNALRPLVTILGLSFPGIFAGSVLVETVFNYPGLGYLLWRSALSQDYPVISAIVLLIGVLTVIGNLLADLVNGLLDPRERYE
ncbi:MAG: ABC transporter permease [Acidiphilium sp.]|nr:ABC transporter permease [Acidiphilium sp.]MDD4935600.1 ABC transporter permease [Acidiphilium sp.]